MGKKLIISTLPKKMASVQRFIAGMKEWQVIFAEDYHIEECRGCAGCLLKTPGKCVIKDDYEKVFKAVLKSEDIILLTEVNYGFISYKMKDIVDRLVSLNIVYTEPRNGAMRSVRRYEKSWNIAIVYEGDMKNDFLVEWLKRFTLNFNSRAVGVFTLEERKMIEDEFNHI